MSRERFRARPKKVQKLGRDGLVEQDRATGEEQRVSQRTADVSFGRERPSERDAAQQGKERSKKARLRAQIAEYQQPSVPADTPERTEAPGAPEVPTPEQTTIERSADDVPLTRTAHDSGKTVTARHKRQIKAAARQRDAPRRLAFEQTENKVLRFEPERAAERNDGQPERETDGGKETLSRQRAKNLNRAPRYDAQPREAEHGLDTSQERLAPDTTRRYGVEHERQKAPVPDIPKAAKQRQAAEHTPKAAMPPRRRLRFENAPKQSDMSSNATVTSQRRSATPAEQFTRPQRSRERPTQSNWTHNGDAVKARRRLRFEDEGSKDAHKPKRSGVSPGRAARTAVMIAVHDKPQEAEDGNVAVEAAHEGGIAAEHSAGDALRWQRKRRQRANSARSVRQATRQAARQEHPQFQSSPISRWQQKQAIKRQYAAAKRAGTQTAAAANTGVARVTGAIKAKTADFVRRHKKGFLILGGIILVIAMCSSLLTSCSTLVQSGASAVTATIYPSEDADMLAAEAWYAGKEAELQAYLDTYESIHAYNEYHYELDDIEHDPYVLISALTALQGGAWTIGEVQDTLQMLFDRQYILTETVTSETRTRTVDGEQQEYTYYKCTVTLKNENLSHLPVYIMSEDQLSMYAMYMGTLGNRPDLFPISGYINKYLVQGYTDYEIPASVLEDTTFAAMISEAEKYLGYPYVWGGSNPNTSFDCSGFVSWIINHSGWNVGRLGAQSLYNICTPTNNPRPGDLIFFTGTFAADTPVTHVGLYVGDGWMIHAGDPISYASVNSNYFRAHYYAYGRLP